MKPLAQHALKWTAILYLVIAGYFTLWDNVRSGMSESISALDRGHGVSLTGLLWPLRWRGH